MRVLRAGITVVLAAVAAIVLSAAPASAEKRVALIIGNAAYAHVPRLANSTNDARLIADTLGSLGFQLVGGGPHLDLDKAGLDAAVQYFGVAAQGADVALFYYAGHGVQVRGANYLVPVGANPVKENDVDFQMLDVNLVLRQMEGAGAKLNIVILDACRNNPFGGRALRSTGSGLAQMLAPEGTLISFATQPGNVAVDGEGLNSPFTQALAQTMRKPSLGLFDLFNEVGLAVKNATSGIQQPWLSSSPIAGRFCFACSPESTTTTAPPTTTAPGQSSLPPPPGEAASAYRKARQVGTCGAYEAFARSFKGTFEATLAEEHINTNCGPGARPSPSAAVTPPTTAPPPLSMRTFRVNDDVSQGVLNLRAGPGTNHAIVAPIPAGVPDLRVGRCRTPDDGSNFPWCEVEWRSFTGWASSCCMTEAATSGRPTFRVLNDVSRGILYMRRGPGTHHAVVVAIPAGASGVLVGRCRKPDDRSRTPWCEVEWRGHKGWASACCMVDVSTGAHAKIGD